MKGENLPFAPHVRGRKATANGVCTSSIFPPEFEPFGEKKTMIKTLQKLQFKI